MTRLLAALAVLLCLTGTPSAATWDPLELQPVIAAMNFDGVRTRVTWETCGTVNAYYVHRYRKVVLCNELLTLEPGVIRYILAHELAHATIMQRNVAYTGSHEWAADELAALMLVATGRSADVMEGAMFWAGLDREEDPFDDHPGDLRRAHNLACMVWTHDGDVRARGCNTHFIHVAAAWIRLLGMG